MDRIDFDIMRILQNDARIANKVLADRVGLAPSSCLERVRRLRQQGVLLGAHAVISRRAAGVGLEAMIFVRLARHARASVESFHRHAESLGEVVSVFHVSGEHDFIVQVAARDAEHLRSLAMDAFTTRSEVAQIETHLIFERSEWPALPIYAGAGD